MNTSLPPQCPFHASAAAPAPVLHPAGTWPPGPPAGLTGWGLLRRMSRDLLGTLAAWKREHGDLVHLRMWPEHQVVVTDPALARELLVHHHDALIRWERGIRVFAQLHGHSVLIAEGETWRRKRQALQPSFTPKAVQAFVPGIADAAAAFARWPTGNDSRWTLDSALTSLTMDVIMQMLFSSALDDDARQAERAVHDSAVIANAEFYWPASSPDWVPWKRAKRQALRVLNGLIGRHIEARLHTPVAAWPEDLLTRLLHLHREDAAAWPLQAVRDECMTTFLAGHETAAATLIWWCWCMASNPAAQAAARTEVHAVLQGRAPATDDVPALAYLGQTLQETLRLYPAVPVLMSRRSTRPIVLGGWQLPAGTMFTLPVQLLQHDPRWFPEPLAFRPERFAPAAPAAPRGSFMPFGTGPRVCLGQHLALTELTVIAAMLLQRFSLAVSDGAAAPRPVLNISLRPDRPLPVRLTPASGMA